MLQHNGNNIVNSSSLHCNTFTQCCATQAANAAIAINYSNTPTQYMSSTRQDSNNYTKRPKRRDFQFKVIKVPKWFIVPSSSSNHSNKKHVKNPANNNKENINQKKQSVQTNNGYSTGGGSDKEHKTNNSTPFLSEISMKSIKNVLENVSTSKNQCCVSMPKTTSYDLQNDKNNLNNAIAINHHSVLNSVSTSQPTTHCCPSFNKVEPTTANPLEHIPTSLKVINDNKSVTNTNVLTNSTDISPNLSSGFSSGVFEILAVSKKDDNDYDDDDDDDFGKIAENNFNYSDTKTSSIPQNSNANVKRSSSVMEYYSNSGCYTCITGKCLENDNTNK